MDKLRIGIFPEYPDKEMGGGFSYCNTLMEAIENYPFDESLDFVFIHFGKLDKPAGSKKWLQIEPFQNINKRTGYQKGVSQKFIKPVAKFLKPLERLQWRYEAEFEDAYRRSIELELAKNKIDLLYYTFPKPQQFNYPYVATQWDVGHMSMYSFPEVSMNSSYEDRQNYFRTTLEKAFCIFCESETGKAELIQYTAINKDRFFVVPLFPGNVVNIKIPLADQVACLQKHLISEKKYFFYPAQFWSHKNHYNLLVAFEKLHEKHPDIKMLFSGSDKGNLEYIKTVVNDLGLQKNVVIPGFVSNEEIYSFYKNALALVMPTFLGPTNMPLLEAEALGCPVICSDLKGHREMLGENAWYVEPDNPESIYEGMLHHLPSVLKVPHTNAVFNIENALQQIEANFLKVKAKRKAFGFNFQQY
jgi:glycosyltransferase involved in cell wall biosynthesis